jgi:hypothetical protein
MTPISLTVRSSARSVCGASCASGLEIPVDSLGNLAVEEAITLFDNPNVRYYEQLF